MIACSIEAVDTNSDLPRAANGLKVDGDVGLL
jgi:hypothetical protein